MNYQMIIEDFIFRKTAYRLYQWGGDKYTLFEYNTPKITGTYQEIAEYILTLE